MSVGGGVWEWDDIWIILLTVSDVYTFFELKMTDCTELQYVEEGCGTDFVQPLPLSEKILFYVKTLNQT